MLPHEIANELAIEIRLNNPDGKTIKSLTEDLEDLMGYADAIDMVRIALYDQGLR